MADASGASSQSYDVFISHRGTDVKNTFATALYRNLHFHGLQVFLDKSEMRVGHDISSQLEAAIRAASVHVAIFSPNYAQSKWCLDELLLMVESVKLGRATLIPVFYDVKPAELRWTGKDKSGVYAVALRHHEEVGRHSIQTVQNWTNALSYVAGISGLELATFHGDVLELLHQVVQRVVKIVPKPPLFVAKHPTGLQQKVKELERRVLSVPRQDGQVKVVGIVGSGGVGKTTVAKQYYNDKMARFDGSSFLFDVASKMPLKSLQKKLIKDLKGIDIEIDSSDEGFGKLDKNLSNCRANYRALIVLDDIDHVNQLDAFLPIHNALHPDSLLLVTSRDKQVLRCGKIKTFYDLEGLNKEHSRKLFCAYAFSESERHPPPEFNDVVDRFLTTCSGLPLSLKVLGALLYEKNDKSLWQEILNGLDQLLPDDIHKSLRVSYDCLKEQVKQIFLDIACFCIGEKSDKWIKIWGGSGWQGLAGLDSLKEKCIIEVDGEDIIRMHDHFRIMGRNIAERSFPTRRSCDTSRDVYDLLEESLDAITEVRAIRLVPPSILGDPHTEEYFRLKLKELLNSDQVFRIKKLQLLEGEGDFVEGMLKVKVRSLNLIYLRWNDCPCSCLPSFPMQDLRVLEVDARKLGRLWEYESQAPRQLRQLIIDAPLLEFPKSLGKLQHLEKIVVKSARLTTLPYSLGDLRNLQHIALVGCENLEILPDSLGNLTNLRHMDLSMCKSLRVLPDSMEKLTNLQFINLKSSCKSLEKLPDSLLNIKNLCCIPAIKYYDSDNIEFHIDFSGFQSLKMLPDSLRNQKLIGSIKLTGCESLKMLPDFLGQLRCLEAIDLEMCKSLEMLPESFGNLESLYSINLIGCESLKMLPNSLGWDQSFEYLHLHLKGCCSLTISTETLGNVTNLECLDLSCCPQMESLPPVVGRQQFLKKLNLLDTNLRELPCDVVSLKKLHRLSSSTLRHIMVSSSIGSTWIHRPFTSGKSLHSFSRRMHIFL